MELHIASGDYEIAVRLSGMTEETRRARVLIIAPGFERLALDPSTSAEVGSDLADALSEESGWVVCSLDYRIGRRPLYSQALDGLRLVVDKLASMSTVGEVWIAGFSEGGSLALSLAAEDARLCGVASLGGSPTLGESGVSLDDLIAKIPPRPILLVHGAQDEQVPLTEIRVLVEAAEGNAELRVVQGADHQLRHDPRAVAVLLGWMERQALSP